MVKDGKSTEEYNQIKTERSEMNRSENISELAGALAKAQAVMENAKKDGDNPFFRSKYSTLSSVWDACREPLSNNELSVIQTTIPSDESVIVETTLAHVSGQWVSSVLSMKPGYINKSGEFIEEKDAQAFGSCLTYARRYALSAMVGICPEDDDGNKASNPEEKTLKRNAPIQKQSHASNPEEKAVPLGNFRQEKSYQKLVDGFRGGGWKDVELHFGKNKGKAIQDLEPNQISWYANEWEPKPYEGKLNIEDMALRAAFDAAREDKKEEQIEGAKD